MKTPDIYIKGIEHITYRGVLKSCNYSCPYCVFSRKKESSATLISDHAALTRFREYISTQRFNRPLSILIAPYGEAMLHTYYWDEMSEFSRLEGVAQISCQTNLSFSIDAFHENLKKNNANFNKLALWATFHPSMVTADAFSKKVNELSDKIQICVGVVGDPASLPLIHLLKQKLLMKNYLWVNKMDGLGRPYTAEEEAAFAQIDPLFPLELSTDKNYQLCKSGDSSLFVSSDGTAFPCCRSKQVVGNIYQTQPLTGISDCRARCDCFLAYSNRRDKIELSTLSSHPQLRLPQLHPKKAVLFDIDDTVYFHNNPLRTNEAQGKLTRWYQEGASLFPVTALTRRQAERRLGAVRSLISGGVFAYGADVQIDHDNFRQISSFSSPPPCPPLREFSENGAVYKLLVKSQAAFKGYGEIYAEEQIAVVPHSCSKLEGAKLLLQKLSLQGEDIIVIGNSETDVPLFTLSDFSVAVDTASELALEKARWVYSHNNKTIN